MHAHIGSRLHAARRRKCGLLTSRGQVNEERRSETKRDGSEKRKDAGHERASEQVSGREGG
eukprot:94020-Pleurochrysis_carterae.AAC.3